MHIAFCEGRMKDDPCKFWYKGELGFLDKYVIPLATKLKDCNIFGVSGEEYLNYAVRNRAEWKERGQEIVENMIKELVPAIAEKTMGWGEGLGPDKRGSSN
jgi:hypothetical protein